MVSIEELKKMSYTDFISFINEENRPSGGKMTIHELVIHAFINEKSKVLEIGSTNGFSSIEVHRLTGCDVTGVDIAKASVKNANRKIKLYGLDPDKIKFIEASAERLPFADDFFDVIMCGNALSFIANKADSVKEIIRVLKPSGFLTMVPIWYHCNPPKDIIDRVSNILGFRITCLIKEDIHKFAQANNLEMYYSKDFGFDSKSDDDILDYITQFFSMKPYINNLDEACKEYIKKRWTLIIKTFYENLQLTNFSIVILRKNPVLEEPEMFSVHEVQ